MKRLLIIILLFVPAGILMAQDNLMSDRGLMERIEVISELPPDRSRDIAVAYARDHNIPERIVYRDGTIMEIKRLSPKGKPMYYTTLNLNAARTISTAALWEGGGSGLDLSGSGIVLGMWDAGLVRTTHDEFLGRARIINNGAEVDDHATHVAGTMGATGVKNDARGMANKCVLESYTWENDNAEMASAAADGLLISNHSYGFIQGWNYDSDKSRWEWWGDPSISATEDYNFGFYGTDARAWDEIARDNPRYMIVKSAGNDRDEGPAPGAPHYVFVNGGWSSSTEVREKDGGNDGFDCIGTLGTSKNILTVGAVEDIPGGYGQSSDVKLASYSSIGPTDDGRIKPDLVANGERLYSTTSDSDNSYGFSSGTSMSSPSLAGSLALLQEHYRNEKGSYMYASQLKAIVLHTADEAGAIGPDYKHGWGLMNTRAAAEMISGLPSDQFLYDTLENLEAKQLTFFSTGSEPVRITIVWADPAGKVPDAALDPTDRILVNDLDIRLTREIDDHRFMPWVLDPATPAKPAVTGDNTIDNVEQIFISQPMSGFYTLEVSHKLSLSGTNQPFAIVVTGLQSDYIATGYNELTESNGNIMLSSADRYVNNMDVQWLIQPDNGQPVSVYFDYFETEADGDSLLIYDGNDATAPLLAVFSGSPAILDTLITSSTGALYLTFRSDNQETARGFHARYCTVAPEGSYAIIGDTYPCGGSSSSYFALGQEGADFTWQVNHPWEYQAVTANGISLHVGAEQGELTVTPYNRCGTGSASGIGIIPQQESPSLLYVTGDTVPCDGENTMLVTNRVEGTSYNWDLPENWAGVSQSDTLYFIPDEIPGIVTVSGTNACGEGSQISVFVDVKRVPDDPVILADKVPPCAYTVQEFYVEWQQGYTYEWETEDDWGIVGPADMDTVLVEVGLQQSFLYLTSTNKCGSRRKGRLFLTAPQPQKALVSMSTEAVSFYPELNVQNADDFRSVRWYRNGEALSGEQGTSNRLVVNLNGVYVAESVSDLGCTNRPPESEGIRVDLKDLMYRVYRTGETGMAIENGTSGTAAFTIVDLMGRVQYSGKVVPGYNEFSFYGQGVFMVWFYGNGIDQSYKVLF